MHPRLHRVLRLTFAATLALTFGHVHAIPKAAEDADGTVEIVADVPRPKASAKAPKPAAKPSNASARKNTKATAKVGKSSSTRKAAATSAKKPARGKK